MKFGKIGTVGTFRNALLVSAAALLVATLFTACGTLTVGFLYVSTTRQTPGQIEVYEVNSESGVLRTIPTSPFPSGGRDPISEAVSPDYKWLYAANQDDNNIVEFGIGNDGKLYPQNTVNIPGAFPVSIAVNAAGTYLYAVDTLSPVAGCTLANPCPGALSVFPINSDGSLGNPVANNNQYPNYWPLLLAPTNTTSVLTPTAVNVLANGDSVYVTAYNAVTNAGYLFAYSVNGDGTLSQLNGSVPLSLGSEPVAMASDTGSAYLYVADKLKNKISSFQVGSGGALTLVGTTATGNLPMALALFNDKFLYVANSLDSTVTGYTIGSGSLATIATYASDDNCRGHHP